MNKNKFILTFLLILVLAIAFPACTNRNESADYTDGLENRDGVVADNGDDPVLSLAIPNQITLNNIIYNIDYNHSDFIVDEQIGYLVNRNDYQSFYEENPDMLYAIDEANTIVNISDDDRIAIYSIQGYDMEQYIGLYSFGTMNVFVNFNYKGVN